MRPPSPSLVLIVALRAKDSAAAEGRKLDLPGQITLALGLIAVLYATVTAVDAGFGSAQVIASYVVGGILLVAFVVIESRTAQPLIHLSLFKNSAYSITGIVAVTGMFAFLAICFSTSVAVGGLALAETWKVGVLFVFIQGPAFAFIPVVGWLIHHVAPRWVLTAGFALMAVSGFWLSTFALGTPEAFGGTPWTAFIPPLLLLGIGFALTVGSVTAVAINTVPPQHIGMASATTNLLRDLGFALGPVVGSAIAFGIGATAFAGPLAGILGGAGLPAEAVSGLANVPPLGFLSGWDGVIAQFSGQAAGRRRTRPGRRRYGPGPQRRTAANPGRGRDLAGPGVPGCVPHRGHRGDPLRHSHPLHLRPVLGAHARCHRGDHRSKRRGRRLRLTASGTSPDHHLSARRTP